MTIMRRNLFSALILSLALFYMGPAFAQRKPVQNVGRHRHPNLAAAQRLTERAFQRITAAQQANEFDLAGHAAKAKDLLDQANQELKKAAEVSNVNHK